MALGGAGTAGPRVLGTACGGSASAPAATALNVPCDAGSATVPAQTLDWVLGTFGHECTSSAAKSMRANATLAAEKAAALEVSYSTAQKLTPQQAAARLERLRDVGSVDKMLPAEESYAQLFVRMRWGRLHAYSACSIDPGARVPLPDAAAAAAGEQVLVAEVATMLRLPASQVVSASDSALAALRASSDEAATLLHAYTAAGMRKEAASARLRALAVLGAAATPPPIPGELAFAAAFEPVRDFRQAVVAASTCKPSVIVQKLTGAMYAVAAEVSDTVATFKGRIQGQEGTAVEDLRLVFAGKQLEDGRTLAEYGICHGAMVHQVHRLRGD